MSPYPFPARAGIEPSLSDMLSDEVMHKLLARDGLNAADLRAFVHEWRDRRDGTGPDIAGP